MERKLLYPWNIVPSIRIATLTDMEDAETMNEILLHLVGLEEDRFIAGFHQQVQKPRENAWYDRHIKNKIFKVGDLVLLYDSKFAMFPGKFYIHLLGPYQVKHVTSGGAVELAKLNGEVFPTLVNGSRLKLHRDNPPACLA
jgi:hypothetical protein